MQIASFFFCLLEFKFCYWSRGIEFGFVQNDDGGDGDGKRSKTSGNSKGEEISSGKHAEETSDEPHPKKDYIHVRARRGQATDSHSLAERVFSYFLILTKCIFIRC